MIERPIIYALTVAIAPVIIALAWCAVASHYCRRYRARNPPDIAPDEPEETPPGLT